MNQRFVVAGPQTCQSLEAVQLEDVGFQHLNPWTAHFRRQLGADGEQPEVGNTSDEFWRWVKRTNHLSHPVGMGTYEWNIEASMSFSLELSRARPKRMDTG